MNENPNAFMVENLEARRSALGQVADMFNRPPVADRESEVVVNALAFKDHASWGACQTQLELLIRFAFPSEDDVVMPHEIRRVTEAPYSSFGAANLPHRQVMYDYVNWCAQKIRANIAAGKGWRNAAVIANAEGTLDKERRSDAKVLKASALKVTSTMPKYDNARSKTYSFNRHVHDFKNHIMTLSTHYDAGLLLLNEQYAEDGGYFASERMKALFDGTLDYDTKSTLDTSLKNAKFEFTTFEAYIRKLEEEFNAEHQLFHDVLKGFKEEKINRDEDPLQILKRFDALIAKNDLLPGTSRASNKEVIQYFCNSIARGENPHNQGLTIYLRNQVPNNPDWVQVKNAYQIAANVEPEMYHTGCCPDSAPCKKNVSSQVVIATVAQNHPPRSDTVTVDPNDINGILKNLTKVMSDGFSQLKMNSGTRSRLAVESGVSSKRDVWQNMSSADLLAAKEAGEKAEGCKLNCKPRWVSGDPPCTHCTKAGKKAHHHSCGCYSTYPWLFQDDKAAGKFPVRERRPFRNARGGRSNDRGGRNNEPYRRRRDD